MIQVMTAKCAGIYREQVEKLLRSIGANEGNASEFEMRTQQGDGLNAEIWRNGIKVGKVTTRWETQNGYRFVVTTVAY